VERQRDPLHSRAALYLLQVGANENVCSSLEQVREPSRAAFREELTSYQQNMKSRKQRDTEACPRFATPVEVISHIIQCTQDAATAL